MASRLSEVGLFTCQDVSRWKSCLDKYSAVISALSVKKASAKSAKKNAVSLKELDDWFQNDLLKAIKSRNDRYLTHDELVKLMQWKLTRGKFRPRLGQMVAENKSSDVQSVTRRAFGLLPDIKQAIEELCKLRAIGPATASAVLCAGAPDFVCFMADEAVESVPSLVPVQYTLTHYLKFSNSLTTKTRWLKANDKTHKWNVHEVELALWTDAWSRKLDIPSSAETAEKPETKASLKRSRTDEEEVPAKKKKKSK